MHPPGSEAHTAKKQADPAVEETHVYGGRGRPRSHDAADKSTVLKAVIADFLRAEDSGHPPERDDLLVQYPDLSEELSEFFNEHDQIRSLVPPHREAEPRRFSGRFDHYEIIEEIGGGGMGVVYKARDLELGRIVALKMILPGARPTEKEVRRFREEARRIAALSHQGIVRVYEAGEFNGQPYFAMEYIEGTTLAKLPDRPAPEQAAAWVATIARAVEYLHQHGMVHRDLKPSNILLDEAGLPYVSDFGLARVLEANRQHSTTGVVGTAPYMPPEQAAGRHREIGVRSDVYGLGAVLYELLTGRPPFREESPLETLVQVIEGEPTLPRQINPALPRDLESICLRCLEKNPQDRYPSAAALAEDLEAFLRGEDVQARPQSGLERLRRWARRQPALATRLAALAVCILVQLANYHFFGLELTYHLEILALLALWGVSAVAFRQLMHLPGRSEAVRLLWAGSEPVFLTVLLSLVPHGFASQLVVGYALLIAASGLWFRVRVVWFVTGTSLLAYAALVAARWTEMTRMPQEYHRHTIFSLILMAVVGVVVAYQVRRVKALSHYYQNRPLP